MPPQVLYNSDCNYLFQTDYRPAGQQQGPYTTAALDAHVDRLADAGINVHIINGNAQKPWYPSRSLEHVLTGYTRGDKQHVATCYPPVGRDISQADWDMITTRSTRMLDRFLDLQEAGIDWLAHLATQSQARGMEAWASLRMNDAHGSRSWEHCYFNGPPQRNPANRVAAPTMNPALGNQPAWQLCSYDRPEVRDYYLQHVRELMQDYSFTGLELDWLRCAVICDPTASTRQIDAVIDFNAQVRALTEARAKQIGRPVPLGLRIPARLGALRTLGLDVVELARLGLIDFIAPSNFFQSTWNLDYHDLRRQLGDRVQLFGVIECTPNWLWTRDAAGARKTWRLTPTSAPLIRGNAAAVLAGGADAIEFFNFFCADAESYRNQPGAPGCDYGALRGIGELDALRGKPKHYVLPTTQSYWSPRFVEHAGQLPATLETGSWKHFHFNLIAEPPDAGRTLRVQLVIDRAANTPELGVSLNGTWPTFKAQTTAELLLPAGDKTHHDDEVVGLNYELPLAALIDGRNELTVYDGSEDTSPAPGRTFTSVRIRSVEIAIL